MAKNILLPGVLCLCVLALLCKPSFAQDAYRGKTITLIASHPPGGLYDAHARVLARHLGKHIPGNPRFVVQNMPGEERLKILREAMLSVSKDPAFVAEWERTFGQQLAPVVVSAAMAETLKNEFLESAPWQDFLRRFVTR